MNIFCENPEEDVDIHQANPQARQEGDKLLILLADRLSMVEHHQPAWTSLQVSYDHQGRSDQIDKSPTSKSSLRRISLKAVSSSFVSSGTWLSTSENHTVDVVEFAIIITCGSPADISL